MKISKRLGSIALAVAILASSMTAFACANDQFVAYDHEMNAEGQYEKVYYCPEFDKVWANGVAEKVEWKFAFYEAEYPHREVEVLYLDDTNTGYTRYTGETADVNTKEVAELWEAKAPYLVYNRLYSDFTGTFEPTNTIKVTNKTAPVVREWAKAGFEQYIVEDGVVKNYSKVYEKNLNKVDIEYNLDDLVKEYNAMLAAGKGYNVASQIFTDVTRADRVKNVSWLKLTGPDYVTSGSRTITPFAEIAKGADASYYDNLLVTTTPTTYDNLPLAVDYENQYADIEWVTVGYEKQAPYRYYQVLSINGILMDGSEIELVGETVNELEEVGTVDVEYGLQLVKKDSEQSDYSYDVENDYLVDPLTGTTLYTTTTEDFTYEVVEGAEEVVKAQVAPYDNASATIDVEFTKNVREKVYQTIVTPNGAEYEVRMVKRVVKADTEALPYIYRMIGNADPKVEWKTAFAEAKYPYEIYEEKFVDDQATAEYRSTGKYAEPVVTLKQEIGQPRILNVVLKDTTGSGLEWILKSEDFDYRLAGQKVVVNFTPEGGYVTDGWDSSSIYDDYADTVEAGKIKNVEVVDNFPGLQLK